MKDWLARALKTFVQAIIPVFIANATLIGNHFVAWDWADWRGWLMPIIISAVSAGISAVWNLLLESWNKNHPKDANE